MYKTEDLAKLKDFFPPDSVSWRAGSTNGAKTSCLPLAYIDARDVQDRLDAVVGPENWQTEYMDAPGGGVLCGISIRVPILEFSNSVQITTPKTRPDWVTKWDGADQTQFEAVKGGLSDAFKRAAVQWGVGRYLYGMKAPWVPCEARGNSVTITKEGYQQLEKFLREWYAKHGVPTSKQEPAQESVAQPEKTEKSLIGYGKTLGFTAKDLKATLEEAGFAEFDLAKYDEMIAAIKAAAAKRE